MIRQILVKKILKKQRQTLPAVRQPAQKQGMKRIPEKLTNVINEELTWSL